MDHYKRQHTSSKKDSSALRRTQSIAVVNNINGEESSVSSLGSFPEPHLVAQQFSTAKLSRQQTIAVDSPIFGSSSKQRKKQSYNVVGDPSGANQKHCPHCRKTFSSPWAVPKHVMRVHNRSGDFHCPRCLFKTSRQEALLQHEKDSHRKCPYCRQLFVLLNKHIGACSKRPL